ncbi:MAG: putative DNA binding domain-containing protein, partial [Muribaculaceae bacterium]|nr:putative DNA binding domain-containing protein [Muribaculaceae bacterium]
ISMGENEHQDFKYSVSDARKIARSISAFTNNGGGRLLIGVKDNGVISGVRNEEDVYVVELAASRYCRPPHPVEFHAYKAEGGILVIVAEIEAAAERPVCVAEADGRLRAYYRVADENIAASPLMEAAWRQAASSAAPTLVLGAVHTSLLEFLAEGGALRDERQAAIALHVSVETAREAIVALAAAGLVGFRHGLSGFEIVAAAEN